MNADQPTQTPQTQPSQTPNQALANVPPRRELRVVEDNSAVAYLMDTARFDHSFRIAAAMARASLIPKHLKGENFEQTQANCFLVVNQSLRWQFDPFAVAPETYEVGGKLGFSGKLVAAVINVRGGLMGNLSYTFNDAKGDALEVTVSGHIEGEDQPRTVTLSVAQAKTGNQMWTKDPHQKLIYSGATKWARRHKPEVILGVLTDDDAEAIRDEARAIAAKPAKTPQFSGPKVIVSSDPPTNHTETPKATAGPEKETEPAQATKATETAPQEAGEPKSDESQSLDGDLGPQTAAPADLVATPAPVGEFKAKTGETQELTNLRYQMHISNISEERLVAYCKDNAVMKPEQTLIRELSTAKHKQLVMGWPTIAKLVK